MQKVCVCVCVCVCVTVGKGSFIASEETIERCDVHKREFKRRERGITTALREGMRRRRKRRNHKILIATNNGNSEVI